MNSNNMACKWNPSLFQYSLLIEFTWTLYILAMCGGTIFHCNIWSFSKCSENCKSIASDYNFFVSICYKSIAGDYRMSQLFCQCCASSIRPEIHAHCPRPPVHARTLSPRPNFVCALMSAPKDSTRLCDVCGSRPKLSTPMPIPAYARSCFGWRLAHCRGQLLQTSNRHVSEQQ